MLIPTTEGRPRSYCFTTDPFLMGIIIVFGGGPALYLARSLRNVYDPLGNRQELELVLWTAIICGGTTRGNVVCSASFTKELKCQDTV